MQYQFPLSCAVAAVVYNGTFNATSGGPMSADQMQESLDKLPFIIVARAEAQLNLQPELIGEYCQTAESSNPTVELMVREFCKLLGLI